MLRGDGAADWRLLEVDFALLPSRRRLALRNAWPQDFQHPGAGTVLMKMQENAIVIHRHFARTQAVAACIEGVAVAKSLY